MENAARCYSADQLTDGVFELFVKDLGAGEPGPGDRVNGPLPAGGSVGSAVFAPAAAERVNSNPVAGGDIASPVAFSTDGAQLAFAADLEVDERNEAYLSRIADGTVEAAERVQAASTATCRIRTVAFAADGSLGFVGNTARASLDLWITSRRGAILDEAQRVNVTTARDSGVIQFWLRP